MCIFIHLCGGLEQILWSHVNKFSILTSHFEPFLLVHYLQLDFDQKGLLIMWNISFFNMMLFVCKFLPNQQFWYLIILMIIVIIILMPKCLCWEKKHPNLTQVEILTGEVMINVYWHHLYSWSRATLVGKFQKVAVNRPTNKIIIICCRKKTFRIMWALSWWKPPEQHECTSA